MNFHMVKIKKILNIIILLQEKEDYQIQKNLSVFPTLIKTESGCLCPPRYAYDVSNKVAKLNY